MPKHSTVAILTLLALALSARGDAPAQTAMEAGKAAKTRYDGTVVIAYFSHFEASALHDWVPIKEWNGPYHPTLGDYKTSDRKIVRQHLQWLRRAGVDVILYDTCRIQPELNLLKLPEQKTLKLIVDELSHQEKETRKLKLAVWLEKWNSTPTAEEYKFGLDYIRKNLANRDFYYRLDGKPLVVAYLNSLSPAIDKLEQDNKSFFTFRRVSPYPDMPGWRYFGPEGDKQCMTVNPGANGFMEEAFITSVINHKPIDVAAYRQRGKAAIEQRADGKYFENQLLVARKVDPKVIFISGWNDWAWCLQIEPAKEYGLKYVDMAAKLLGREGETKAYRKRN